MENFLGIQSAPKVEGSERTASLAQAEALIPVLCRRFEITRIGEITRLDRIRIPVVTAFVPRSPDALGVYNGRGTNAAEARVGAVMEASERQSAAICKGQTELVEQREIAANFDLDALGLFKSRKDEPLECTIGVELQSGRRIPVPLALVRTPWDGLPTFGSTNTNGIAAGTSLLDALYHALKELVERHVWSMTHARSHVFPRVMGLHDEGDADLPIASELTLPTRDSAIDGLIAQIEGAGLAVRLLVLQEDRLPLTVHASIFETDANVVQHAFGIGTSWSPQAAVRIAIMEAAQSRVVDIQGAREDMRRGPYRREGLWFYNGPVKSRVALTELKNVGSNDLILDLQRLTEAVYGIGVTTVAAVDITPPDCPIFVVRVVAPDLESYIADHRVGRLAKQAAANALARLTSGM